MTEPPQFVALTESWGMPMPAVQQQMVFRRYRFLADRVKGGRVLEVGCGNGLGNQLLSDECEVVVSSDFERENVEQARAHAPGHYAVADAQKLPYADRSFDAVAACEMIYYVPDQDLMVEEMKRVLRPGGFVFITFPNMERPGFHPSPYSTTYHSVRSAALLLKKHGLTPELYGVFPLSNSPRQRVLRLVATVARELHLVPKTLAGRGLLKKIFFGELTPFAGLSDPALAEAPQPEAVPLNQVCTGYSVLYAVGRMD